MRQKNLEYFNVQKISCYFVGLHGPVAKDCHGLRNLQKNWFLPVPFTCILPGKNYRYIHRFNLSMHVYTLYNVILRIARNLMETKEIIKILTHLFYPINLD